MNYVISLMRDLEGYYTVTCEALNLHLAGTKDTRLVAAKIRANAMPLVAAGHVVEAMPADPDMTWPKLLELTTKLSYAVDTQDRLLAYCHATGRFFLAEHYNEGQANSQIAYVLTGCPFCDIYGRTGRDYDPAKPQTHPIIIETTSHAS